MPTDPSWVEYLIQFEAKASHPLDAAFRTRFETEATRRIIARYRDGGGDPDRLYVALWALTIWPQPGSSPLAGAGARSWRPCASIRAPSRTGCRHRHFGMQSASPKRASTRRSSARQFGTW
jgi:hypothetical protein